LKKEKAEKGIVADNLNQVDSEKKNLQSKLISLQNQLEDRNNELARNREDFENHIKNYDRRLEEVAKERDTLNDSIIKIQSEKENLVAYLEREREEKESLSLKIQSLDQALKVIFLNKNYNCFYIPYSKTFLNNCFLYRRKNRR
jgi:chromosome segregation ATPase